MTPPFSRTFRSIDADSGGTARAVLFGAVVLLAAWGIWFARARLSVYVASDTAQLEVVRATHPVDAPMGGRVVEMNVALDTEVRAGDVLVVLDSESERLALAEAVARADGIAPQLAATRDTLAAEEQALNDVSYQSHSAVDEARARLKEATVSADQVREEAARLDGLHAHGAVSEIEASRARVTAEQQGAQVSALKAQVRKIQHEFHTNRDDRRTHVAELARDASRLDAELAAIRASIETIKHDIDRHSIRAPADGRLGEIGLVRPGSVVKEGDRIATVVASGPLRVVAQLPPASALGRVKPGQLARVRLDGFPWTEFGDVTARVTDVASEVRESHARVELVILAHSPMIPLQHGMPGSVEIEVEKATPMQLVLRAAGRMVAQSRPEPAPTNPPAIAGGG